MSKCPHNDIHSLYFDNELPEAYKLNYEKHIETCEHCQNKLAMYKKIKASLNSLEVSTNNGNYEKLKSELRFRNTVSKSTNPFMDFSKKYSPMMVAAAVLAVFLPVFSFVMNGNISEKQSYDIVVANNDVIDNRALQVALANQNTTRLKQAFRSSDIISNGNFYNASFADEIIDYDSDFGISNNNDTLPLNVLLFVTPSTVINSVDSFGLERPVFLLQE